MGLEGGGSSDAEAAYRRALARDPDDADAHFRLAGLLAADGRAEEAVTHYDSAQALDAGFKPRVAEDRRRRLRDCNEDAARLIGDGRHAEADRLLGAAEVLVPGDATTLFLRGRSREAQGDAAGAVEAYRLAVVKSPGDREKQRALAGALAALAEARYEEGAPREAWNLLQEVRRNDPAADLDYVEGTVAYALARTVPEEERGPHLDAAADAFARHLRRHPQDADARFNLGAVLLAAERYGEAVAIYLDLIAADPQDGDLYMVLSRAHSFAGQPEMAAAEEAVGHALRAGEPVENTADWAARAAARFPGSDLAETYAGQGTPEAIHTYSLPGGALVEVWFYWIDGSLHAFREGAHLGPPVTLPRR